MNLIDRLNKKIKLLQEIIEKQNADLKKAGRATYELPPDPPEPKLPDRSGKKKKKASAVEE